MKRLISLRVNGEVYELEVAPHKTLLDVIRDSLGLMGTKESCSQGECAACTVLMDGRPVLSCLTLAVEAQGCEITTIEGISAGGKLHPVQEAFIKSGAIQCGYCTPGLVLTAKALLDVDPHPSQEEIRRRVGGNICRCTGYTKIVEAVELAARGLEREA